MLCSGPQVSEGPTYAVPDRSHFFTVHLAAKAAAVTTKLTTYLLGFVHLTLSFDGWSSVTDNILSVTLLLYIYFYPCPPHHISGHSIAYLYVFALHS